MHDHSDLPFTEREARPKSGDRPVATAGEFACWLPRHRKSVGEARGILRGFLGGLTGGEPYVAVGELVLSELVTNAVRHARAPRDRRLWVRFELSPGVLRIEVHDASSVRPTVRRAGGDDEAGRGLWLVEQLSQRWGCCPRAGGIGKAVWALVGPAAGQRSHQVRESAIGNAVRTDGP
ncbi:ATP-binding protein [Kitasatospora aureofaciens]|uniref:ATP-binding protein n=1 Tax=Kitasatospora aureofaciens TaxID=1894 RepID=UPI001C46A9BF|nr:ATP-binding protein [Kitasatospora aureofaciens]MBV6699384.1 ATP-binding protein [Kitasatospora aureofaciens]